MTKIEWVQNPDSTQGKTWNPITGCTKTSEGCRNCYAERMARRLAGQHGYPEQPHHFDVTLHPDRLDEPLRRKKPTTYFVVSMGDLLHEDIEWPDIADVWEVMSLSPQHTFQVLTKRPQRMKEFLMDYWLLSQYHQGTVLSNAHLGVTAENQATADERIPILLQTPAAVRFVSIEPCLGAINIVKYLPPLIEEVHDDRERESLSSIHGTREAPPGTYLDWVIVGGESGPGARPMNPNWVRSLRKQCQAARVAFFFKQWGAWLPYDQDPKSPMYGVPPDYYTDPDAGYTWSRVGKKKAGHLLDGQEWREFPT